MNTGGPYNETLGVDLFNNGRGRARPPGVPRNSLETTGIRVARPARRRATIKLGARQGRARHHARVRRLQRAEPRQLRIVCRHAGLAAVRPAGLGAGGAAAAVLDAHEVLTAHSGVKERHMRHALAMAAILCLAAVSGLQGQEGPYHAGPVIPIGGEGGWDYLLGRLGGASPLRQPRDARRRDRHADEQSGRRHPRHAGRPRLRIAVPELGKGFSSNGRGNNVSVVDLKTLKLIQKIDTGENPDTIVYEPAKKEVYTMNGRGKSASVIDTATGKVVATIPLEGKPETGAGRLQGRQDLRQHGRPQLGEGDRHRDAQGDRDLAGAPCEAATGMAFDVATHRLFLGCDNKLMVMMDSTNGKVVYSVPVGEGVDATSVRSRHEARVHLERRRRHRHGRARRLAVGAEGRPDDQDRPRRADDGARSGRRIRSTSRPPTTSPQAPGSKDRPKAVAGTFRVLTYQMK